MKKKIYTIVLIIMIVLIYMVMFSFSAQNGEQSGGLSFLFSKKIIEIADFFSVEEWSLEEVDTKTEAIEFVVRKTAHFSEYAALGFCWFALLWISFETKKKRILITVGILLLSGVVDEVHQMFVPGRYPSIWDVLLDTAGGVFGMYLFSVVNRISLRRKKFSCETDG